MEHFLLYNCCWARTVAMWLASVQCIAYWMDVCWMMRSCSHFMRPHYSLFLKGRMNLARSRRLDFLPSPATNKGCRQNSRFTKLRIFFHCHAFGARAMWKRTRHHYLCKTLSCEAEISASNGTAGSHKFVKASYKSVHRFLKAESGWVLGLSIVSLYLC